MHSSLKNQQINHLNQFQLLRSELLCSDLIITPTNINYSQMSIKQKPLQEGDVLEAIYHQPKYNHEAMALDEAAEMAKHLGGLIHAGRSISFPFDHLIEHKGYKHGFIILAKLRNEGTIVGKICGVIKDVYLFDKIEKAVYLFDLRVPVTTQKKGVGTFLLQAAEEQSRRQGVTLQIMSINSNNIKIQNLSNKLGWQFGCRRKIFTSTLINQQFLKQNDQSVQLQFLQPKQVNQEQQKCDLSLVNFNQLTEVSNYVGEIKASTKESTAKLHLFKGDKQFGMVPKRVFLKPQTYNYWYTWVILYFLFLIGPVLLGWSSLDKNYHIVSYPKIIMGVIGTLGSLLLLYGLRWVLKMFNAPFIRVFGYQFKGNKSEEQKLCQIVFREARKYAAPSKATIRLNQDIQASYLGFINKSFKGFGNTIFKYKLIDQQKVIRQYDSPNFFDPRDL